MEEIKGLRFAGETTWEEVWQRWAADESNDQGWQQVARDKGWDTWEEWRLAWVANFQAATRKWLLYTIEQPLDTVSNLLIGPAQGWQNRFPEDQRNIYTFADLVERDCFSQHQKIQSILDNFPERTQLIGLVKPNGEIVCIEGHHRAMALAIAQKQNREMVFRAFPTIALAYLEVGEERLFDQMLERGSHKIV